MCNVILGQQFNFRNYSVREGLAQSQVYQLLQDSRGYLWMGTYGGGLSRFDGTEFKNYTFRDGLEGNFIQALIEDQAGNIWIGSEKGLSCFNGQSFQRYFTNELRGKTILAIHEDRNGTFWLGTDQGVFQIQDSILFDYSAKFQLPEANIFSFYEGRHGQLWAGTNRGLLQFGESPTWISLREKLRSNYVTAICEDTTGRLWVAALDGGLAILEDNKVQPFQDAPSRIIQSLYADQEGRIWMGTQDQGVFIWNAADSSLISFTEKEGLCKNDIRVITQDRWENIWLGSSGGGVSCYSGNQFEHYDRSNRLIANRVYAVLRDSTGQIWHAVSNRGVAVMTDSSEVLYNQDNGFLNTTVKALFEDRSGRIWIGTEKDGLAMKDTAGFHFYRRYTDGLVGDRIKDIDQDREGNIWVATTEGLSQLIPNDSISHQFQIVNYGQESELPSRSLNAIHFDSLGRLWCATRNRGLACLKDGELLYHFLENQGLPGNQVRVMVEDSSGYLWLGMAGPGVARIPLYRDSFPIEVLPLEALRSGNIYLLALDVHQDLWIGSQEGVDKVTLDESRWFKDIQFYGKSEGFTGIETCQNAVTIDESGNLWFGTMNGLTKYRSNYTPRLTAPPVLHFTKVLLFYKPIQETEYAGFATSWGSMRPGLVLPYRENDLGFEFKGIHLTHPEKVTYSWMLEGRDTDWRPASTNSNVMYANLAPGSYTFKVQAFNENGQTSDQPQSLSFEILPPFWQKPWFRILVIGLAVLLIGLIFRWRLQAVRRKARRQQEQLSMEKKVLELEQKALQLQMNPHFIFNTLNSIQGLITVQDQRTARYYLARFSRLMRATLEHSRSNWISLEEEINNLKDYLVLEQFGHHDSFDFQIKLDPAIDPDNCYIPPLMIQPFLENAIIHGIGSMTGKGNICLNFTFENKQLICGIEDNGVGREKASQLKNQRDHHHKSMGLQVTQERLELLHQNGQKSLEIQDLRDADGSPAGTRVMLRLPVEMDE
ncbi:MAG: hypothetical protein DHS20C18_47470 [Saprospiraceae bacterium]|nr:MAG: hypothetical protein DHS20C18_47470 [Saprospiraceae bacterium]